jgi:Fic family protein
MNMSKLIIFDRNIPFNKLPELPPAESIFDAQVLLKWGLATRALAELNKNILRMPNPGMLINTISLQEAKNSTAIENIFTTEDELYKAVSDAMKEDEANPATKEVLRYRQALWKGFEVLTKKQKLDASSAIKVFQQIKHTHQGIRPPQSQVVIKRGNSKIKPGEVIYTPPRGTGIIESKLKNLFSYMNDNEKYATDPLLKMVVAHYQFEAIHPFSDGNGRTGRIINLLYLINQKLLSHPVLYLSKYIIENKEEYYHLLSGVTQRQAWKPWLIYMLAGIEQTSKHTNQLIDEIISQMEATLTYARPKIKWYTKEVNEALFTQPYIKPKVIGKVANVSSRTTLTKYMNQLVHHGIVTPLHDGKEVFYINNDLIRILEG